MGNEVIYTLSHFNIYLKLHCVIFTPYLAVTIQWILVSVPLNSDFVLTPTVANVVQD